MATAVFVGTCLAAFVFYMYEGRRLWFMYDDWDYLAGRRASSLNDLFRSHYGHWSTVPILIYRALWWLIGVRSYTPFVFMSVALHIAIATLLLIVMRRVGVATWTATAAAVLYLLFGTAAQDILWSFQIAFKGALALGLVQLLLADHDGGLSRRDWIGLSAGLLALMCSAVGLVMAGVVGLAMLIRRGWRIAIFHAAPLAVAYLVWWPVIGRKGAARASFSPNTLRHWITENIEGVFGAFTKQPVVACLLGVVVVVGVASAVFSTRAARRVAVPICMGVGGVAFISVASLARNTGFVPGDPRAGRYEDVVAALMLPLVAVGVDNVRRRLGWFGPVVVVLLLVGIPGNISALRDYTHNTIPVASSTRRLVTTMAWAPMARNVPRNVYPLHEFPEMFVTAGWLVDGARSGRIPNPGPISPHDLRVDNFRLSWLQTRAVAPFPQCRQVSAPETIDLEHGDSMTIANWRLAVTPTAPDLRVTLTFNPANGNMLTLVGESTRVRIAPLSPFLPVEVCVAGS